MGTRGIKTFEYPQEKKSIEMPLVKAIEHGIGQTESWQKCSEMWCYGPLYPFADQLEVVWNDTP